MIKTRVFNPIARERLGQLHALLDANDVPKPHIIWLQGKALIPLMERIGKEPYPRDGRIYGHELYWFNLETGRYRKVEPREANQ